MNTTDNTVALVPLADLIELATLVRTMRQKQRAFFEARRSQPHRPTDELLHAAKDAERRCDAAVAKALTRSRQQSLPSMEGG